MSERKLPKVRLTTPAEVAQIGHRLSYLRRKQGLTQSQVAEALGLTTNFVSCIERGVSVPHLDTFLDYVHLLGYEAEFLPVLLDPSESEKRSLNHFFGSWAAAKELKEIE